MVSRFFVPEVHPPIVSTVATSRPLPGSAVVRGPRADCTWQIHANSKVCTEMMHFAALGQHQ